MRVLVTGGNGYLGSRLARTMLEQGHEVIVLERARSDTSRLNDILPEITFYSIDEDDIEMPFRAASGIDMVFHTAVSYGRSGEGTFQVFDTNLAFSLRMLELSADNKVGMFVNMDTSVNRSLNVYALSKRQFAEWGEHFSRRKLICFMNMQLEHFYGPGDSEIKFTTHIIRQCLENVPELDLTPGEQKRDFIFIDDVIAAIIALSGRVEPDVFYRNFSVGSGRAVSIRDFTELVKMIAGSTTQLNFGAIPYRENEDMLLQADISALENIGWSPSVSLEEGLSMTVEAERQTLQRSLK